MSSAERPGTAGPPGSTGASLIHTAFTLGLVRDIRRMYEDGMPCPVILDHLSAARAVLAAVALLVIEDHVTACFEPAFGLDLDEARATRLLTAIAWAAKR